VRLEVVTKIAREAITTAKLFFLLKHALRLVATRARGGRERVAGRRRSCPARAGGIASLSPALERPPGREAGEREARARRERRGAI
jgi:hypothetical protein